MKRIQYLHLIFSTIFIIFLLMMLFDKPDSPSIQYRTQYKYLKGEIQRVDSIVYQKKKELVPYPVLITKVDSFKELDSAALDGCLVIIDTLLSEINKRDSVIFYQDSVVLVQKNTINYADTVIFSLEDSIRYLNRKNKSLKWQRNIGIPAAFGIGLAL